MTVGFALFDTSLGACGLAWGPRGLTGVVLPEETRGKTRARLAKRFPGAVETEPPEPVRRAIGAIVALLSGEKRDLLEIELDLSVTPAFHHRVYALARAIPPGEVLTYGEIARRLGEPGAAQAVGQALGRNPFPIVVPCHRVMAADGRTGGFTAPGGVETKLRMLTIEGARLSDAPCLFDDLPLAAPPRRA